MAKSEAGDVEPETFRRLYPSEFHEHFLRERGRPDSRDLGRAQPTTVSFGPLSTTNGSALVKLGNTQGDFDDFTVASAWERLISDIEAYCRKWQTALTNNYLIDDSIIEDGHGKLHHVHAELAHGTKNYRLDFFFLADRDDGREDWRMQDHHLQTWFGVGDFLTISPVSLSGVVLDAPEATYLLSAVAIALSNCGSVWPAFVPVHDPTRKAFKGMQGMNGPYIRSFEADRIGSQVPVKLMHLEGLYDLFVTKLAFSLPDSNSEYDGKVGFMLRLTYHTPMAGYEYVEDGASPLATPIESYDGDIPANAQWDEDFPWADWYTVDDPVKGFELIACWGKRLIESSLDMAEFENASTLEADTWLLTPIITKGLEEPHQDEQVSFASRLHALSTAFTFSKEAKFMEDFSAGNLTVMQKVSSSTAVPPPSVLDRALKYLFRDDKYKFAMELSDNSMSGHANAIKGAPIESLFSQFCLQALWFGNCNIRSIAVLWMEFVREVRWCWEELQVLPRVSPDEPPDFNTCLIHQKLQLLASCIKRRASGKKRLSANENCQRMDDKEADQVYDMKLKPRHGVVQGQVETMFLKSGEQMQVPITQEPPVMTEDMLLEREHAMAALSESPSGRTTWARLETNMLSSDIAAFKDANPTAIFEDFIRWYSPQDWIEIDEFHDSVESLGPVIQSMGDEMKPYGLTGKLSERMSRPGNIWQKLWESVEPAPISMQRPLFDPIGEGEKVIHYLETLRPHHLLAQMICAAFSSVVDLLTKTKFGDLRDVKIEIEKLHVTIISVLKSLKNVHLSDQELAENLEDWHMDILDLCGLLETTEKHIIMAASLHQKLPFAPRLFLTFYRNYVGLGKQQGKNHNVSLRQMISMAERDGVATLFPPLSLDQTWKRSLRMGNFFNGHEPSTREIVFFHYDYYSSDCTERYRMEYSGVSEHVLSHRMYILGTSNDIQVAYSVVSND